jgi:glycosyltransferase involved in cell wall biosynthesis
MRIAVDARELAPRPTGVGRYLLEILKVWAADPAAADCELLVCAPSAMHLHLGESGARMTTVVIPGSQGQLWEQLRLPLAIRGQADVLFAPAYSAPAFCPVPTVVTIHDVSFCAHPEWFGWREGLRRRWTCQLAAANATTVLTDSAFSRDEIVHWLGVPPSRVRVTPLGVSTRVRPPVPGPRDDAAPLVLCVGTQLNRRHLPDLVRAFAPLARADARARLVIVGENRTFPRQDPLAVARDLGVGAAVEVRPWVADDELAALYGAATTFAWLSTYEGFGLPPLEAMAAGVPVVAYDTAVAREVYDSAAALVPVGHVDAVTAALIAFATDPRRRDAHRDAGRLQAARFDWTRTAQATLSALREAAV